MSRPGWKGTVVPRPSGWRYCGNLSDAPLEIQAPRGSWTLPVLEEREASSFQERVMLSVPRNSPSRMGSPSSSSIEMTSRKLDFNSSRVAPCEWAPGNPGTYPTKRSVSTSRSTIAVKDLSDFNGFIRSNILRAQDRRNIPMFRAWCGLLAPELTTFHPPNPCLILALHSS